MYAGATLLDDSQQVLWSISKLEHPNLDDVMEPPQRKMETRPSHISTSLAIFDPKLEVNNLKMPTAIVTGATGKNPETPRIPRPGCSTVLPSEQVSSEAQSFDIC